MVSSGGVQYANRYLAWQTAMSPLQPLATVWIKYYHCGCTARPKFWALRHGAAPWRGPLGHPEKLDLDRYLEGDRERWPHPLNRRVSSACEALYLTNKNRKELDKLQGNLIKSIVGLNSRYRTSPLLNVLILTVFLI